MQRLTIATVLILVLAGVLAWMAGGDSAPHSVAPALPNAPAEPVSEDLLGGGVSELVGEDLESTRTAEVADPLPQAATVKARSEYPWSRIFGTVVDERGFALSGVKISMRAIGPHWVDEQLYPHPLPSLETLTDERGAFELEVPLPTCDWIVLDVLPDAYHSQTDRHFGPAGGRNQEPVVTGDNDLGQIVLADTGVYEGHVYDPAGQPAAGARVGISKTFGEGGGGPGSVRTREDGSYRVAHVRPGRYGAEASRAGFMSVDHGEFRVEIGRVTQGIDFRLEASPSIAGRVVDEAGEPLADVRLWGWPKGSGRGVGGRTQADGTFRLMLPQNDPYTLEATLEGYNKFDTGREQHFDPGTEGIEVVLERTPSTTYAVVDAVTGEPIEYFGLRIVTVRTEHGREYTDKPDVPGRIKQYPGGLVERRGDSRWDDYTIVAPGYAPQRGRLVHDVEGTPRQTLPLEPAGAIVGRYSLGEDPVANAIIQISADLIPLKPDAAEEEDDFFSNGWGFDMSAFAGRKRSQATGADGVFRIDDLAAGTYELKFSAAGVAPHLVERIHVETGEETDVGNVEAYLPGSITGRVVLTGGVAPRGLTIAFGDKDFSDDEQAHATDVDGRFAFSNLEEGTYYLWIRSKPGVLMKGGPTEVKLTRNQQREIEIDLSARVPAHIEATVRIGGEAVAGLPVAAVQEGTYSRDSIGKTDGNGLASGEAHPGEQIYVEVTSRRGLFLGRSTTRTLYPTLVESVELDFDPGHATVGFAVELLEGKQPPKLVALGVTRAGASHARYAKFKTDDWTEVEGQFRATLGWLEPGDYRLELQIGARKLGADLSLEARAEEHVALAE